VNNQIGFTTDPKDSRSTHYCTDVAKMLQSPIFHVNGEDPEAVAQVVDLAMRFRKTFKRDVVIDMYCYRRRGHNEGDEPSFTQPGLYRKIQERKSVREGYLDGLLKLEDVTREEADEIAERRKQHLEEALQEAREQPQIRPPSFLRGLWSNYKGGPDLETPDVDTGIEAEVLKQYLERMTTLPYGFHPHPKYQRILEARHKMIAGEAPLDWAAAEALAYASLAAEGHRVRLSGQDCKRGTFSHRHAVLRDYETGAEHSIFTGFGERQACVEVINSPLSEAGVLGFEYGYSVAYPDGLTIWEAQFGDFANAAQVIFDQFISSAEDKWRSLSGLTVLLPHGFEGMGPEHSSARIERYFVLAAEDNIQVCVPSTPAQFFHMLRRQVKRPWRKPLIVVTPKSLLRSPDCVSPLSEFTSGRFRRILPDVRGKTEGIRRILMCSGKIYYELESERAKQSREDLAILRVEQLYPLQPPDLAKVLDPYPDETPVYWVQEEPENMGAWRRMKGKFGERLLGRFPFTHACRPASASPATGSANCHKQEQQRIIQTAFGNEATSWY
ncbi:MAG: 2-oxoglutarate dehydrogenase E1 component, partial [Candidatus Hydrogenedentota bacterium]